VATQGSGTIPRHVGTLFHVGTIGDLTDGQLLERFAAGGDEIAPFVFAALVERHGPLVLRVCRSLLRDEHDSQDAFQATVLVLVRKSRSLWVRDSLGPWLHAVAHRAACCARSDRTRRRIHERRAAQTASSQTAVAEDREDLHEALHEEIERLPERYRLAVILCDLEGRTQEQAARHLGCPVGTVKSRLTRGRARLRSRLTGSGLRPSVALAAILDVEAARAALPAFLAETTIRVAIACAAGRVSSAVVCATVRTLLKGALRKMILIQLRKIAVTSLTIGVMITGAGVLLGQGTGKQPEVERRVAGPFAEDPTRLGEAVEEFNAMAARDGVGMDQPRLTDEEVIASIRGWNRQTHPISDEGFDAFQKVAETGQLPPGSKLSYITKWSGYRGFVFDVWWVDLNMPIGAGRGFTYRIRSHMISSRPMTEDELKKQEEEVRRRSENKRSKLDVKP
jgi:RNA polymerase sigma factor (sigma-70 family)